MKAALVWRHEQQQQQQRPRTAALELGRGHAGVDTPAAPPSSSVDGPCRCLCYSPDGSRLVAGVGARVLVFNADGAAAPSPPDAERNAAAAALLPAPSSSASLASCCHSLRGHAGAVLAVAHAGAAGRFASGDETGTVVVWTGGGQPVLRFSHGAGGLAPLPPAIGERPSARGDAAAAGAPIAAAAEPILALAWSACPSQPRLASVSPTELALWDPGAAREVVKVPLLAPAAAATGAPPPRATRAAAWSPGGGRVLALGLSDGSVSLRDGCAGGVELRRVRLAPGRGGAPAAAALAVVWLRGWGSGGRGGGRGGAAAAALSAAALAVSTADGRLHEVVLPPARGDQASLISSSRADEAAAAAPTVRSWQLGAGMAASSNGGGGGGGGGFSPPAAAAWSNAVSVSLFCPGAEGAPSDEESEQPHTGETLLLLGGACGRVSLVAWRPSGPPAPPPAPAPAAAAAAAAAAASSPSSCPFFDLGPVWWPGPRGELGAEPPAGTAAGDCPDWVWALAQRPGGCSYSAVPAAAAAAAGSAAAPPLLPPAPLPAHLPVAHVALGRHDGSVSVVAAHLPMVHALHLSGEHGHVYAAREGLTSVSVRRLRVVASAAAAGRRRRQGAASAKGGAGDGGDRAGQAGVGVLKFGELVQRVGVYGARVAVQLHGRVEVFERVGGATEEDDGASSSGSGTDDSDGAWSFGEEEGEEEERVARRRLGWPALARGQDGAAGAPAAAGAAERGGGGGRAGARAAPRREGDAYALVAALVPVGAERLLGPLSSRAPGACSLLVVGARHVFLCTGARMAAYAVSAAAAAPPCRPPAPPQRPQQAPEREWAFDSAIRYVRSAGGPPGAESLLVGLRSGAVAAVFADRPGPPLPLVAAAAAPPPPPASSSSSSTAAAPPGVRCLDLSADRLRLAVVDDSGTCSVYEPFGPDLLGRPEPEPAVAVAAGKKKMAAGGGGGKEPAAAAASLAPSAAPLWRVRGIESCAWSDAHPDVLAVSGGGELAVHFVPLVVGLGPGAAALASAAARTALGAAAMSGAAAAAGARAAKSVAGDDEDDDDDDVEGGGSGSGGSGGGAVDSAAAAGRRRAAGLLAAAALEEGRLVSPPLLSPPPSTQDAGGGLVVGLAGATAYVLLRPSAAAAAATAAAASTASAASSAAAPALAALSVPLGAAVRHLARQRVVVQQQHLLPPPATGTAITAAAPSAAAAVAPGLAAARAVACLGASRGDWRLLAGEALDALDLHAAAEAFARLRDARGAELAARLRAAAASGAAPPGALRAEVAAWAGRFARASRLFCRAGCPSQAVEMWLAMGRLGPAREVARRCDGGGGGGGRPGALSAAAAAALAAAEAAEVQLRQRQEGQLLLAQMQRRRQRRRQRQKGKLKEGGAEEEEDDDDDQAEDQDDDDDDDEDEGDQRAAAASAAASAAAASAAEEARALASRGKLEAAVGCMIEHGLWEQLRALAVSLPAPAPIVDGGGGEGNSSSGSRRGKRVGASSASASLLKRAAAAFASAGMHDDAAAVLVRLGDTASLVSLHAAAGRWSEAALLAAGGGTGLARRAHLPLAAALAGRGRWAEAARAYARAGLPRLAGRLLRSVAASAAEAGKYAEAAGWARMRADFLALCGGGGGGRGSGGEGEGQGDATAAAGATAVQQKHKLRKRLRAAEAYWAYGFVHDAARQPFSVHPPALVFRAACFVAARGLCGGYGGGGGGAGGRSAPLLPPPSFRASPGGARRLPHGVSLTEALLTVVRVGPALGEAEAARRVGEFLLGLRGASAEGDEEEEEEGLQEQARGGWRLRVPPLVLTPDQLAEVEMAVVCARAAAPPPDEPSSAPPCCARCGAPVPVLAPLLLPPAAGRGGDWDDPDACGACGEPAHVSPLTFERLPLVEFVPVADRREGGGGGEEEEEGPPPPPPPPPGAPPPSSSAPHHPPRLSAERALALVGRGGFRLKRGTLAVGANEGDGGPTAASAAEPCGSDEDREALERAWARAVRAARPGSPLRLPAAAVRRLRAREVAVRRRREDGELQLFRLMDGGAAPVALAAYGRLFCEQDELEAALAAERGAAAAVVAGAGGGGAGARPSYLA